MSDRYLYRALRLVEIEARYALIPKSTEPFATNPIFGVDMVFPIGFGSEINAVRQHQWKQNGFHTRGISTTPFLDRAKFYAAENHIIAKIDTSLFLELGIQILNVNERLGERPYEIACLEDNEMILVYDKDGEFPPEVIVDIIHIP